MNKQHLSNEMPIGGVLVADRPASTVADGVGAAWDGVAMERDRSVWIVDASPFSRECISRSLQAAFRSPVETFASVYDLDARISASKPGVILLSITDNALQETIRNLSAVAHISQSTPIIVVSNSEDPVVIRSALTRGARGYIPASMPFDIAVGVIRFVLAGGTYAPIDFFLAAQWSNASPRSANEPVALPHQPRAFRAAHDPARQVEQTDRVRAEHAREHR